MAGKIQKFTALILILCLAFMNGVIVHASNETAFRLDMDSLNLKIGTSTNITVSRINAQGAQIINIEGIENFDILSQSQRSSTSIVNTDVNYQEDLYYTVMPRNTGDFTLYAIIQYNGQTYTTNTLQVTVGEASSNTGEALQNLFVKTVLSHEEAYLGEKIVLTYELYSRYNIENYGFTDYITIDGVILKDMPEDQLKAEYVYLDGNKYAKFEVRQLILDPIRPGVYTLPSFNLQANVVTESNASGGLGFFFSSTEPMYLRTETKELTVKPLPTEGKPQDFSGIVGQLQLESNYSRDNLKYGDSLTLQVTLSGNCNLDALKGIATEETAGFAVYETQKYADETVINNQYYAQKAFDLIIVPENPGKLELESKFISYFNPVTHKYEKAEIAAASIEVSGDIQPLQLGDNTGYSTSAIETVLINQINYGAENTGYYILSLDKDMVNLIIAIFLVMLAIIIITWLIFRRKKKGNALKLLYKELMSAKDTNEIYNKLNAIIKHCYDISIKASSQSLVRSYLPNEGLAAQVTDVMDYMESIKDEDDKAKNHLKSKVKEIYRFIIQTGKGKI